jgi:hypothetical protein
MKRTLLVLSASLCSLASFAQTLNWTAEVTVANGSTYGSTRPRVAATANNVPLVVWGSSSSDQLNYARGNGVGFGMVMALTPNNVDPAVMSWQGHDIGSYGNTVYVVFKSEPEMMGNIYVKKSIDGGVTWTDTVRVNMMGPYCRFPSIAVTDVGNPAVMYMTFDMNWMSATYVVANSTDGGQTYPMSPANASGVGNSDVCDCCPGYMTTDGNNQVATWRRNNNNRRDMWAAVSSNAGTTFPVGIDVDSTDWMLSSCPSSGPDPHLSGDTLITVFMSGAFGNNRLYITTFNILTGMEGFDAELATNISSTADQNYPFIAGNGDTMMVVWQQNDNGNVNTYYAWSMTGAAGLVNNSVLLNSSVAGMQSSPHVAYSNGMFHVVFTDMASGNVIYKSATIVPSGIDEASSENVLNAYPNPSSGDVTLDVSSLLGHDGCLTLTDATGRVVISSSVVGNSNVLIARQAAGVYMAEITDEVTGGKFVTRVVFY